MLGKRMIATEYVAENNVQSDGFNGYWGVRSSRDLRYQLSLAERDVPTITAAVEIPGRWGRFVESDIPFQRSLM